MSDDTATVDDEIEETPAADEADWGDAMQEQASAESQAIEDSVLQPEQAAFDELSEAGLEALGDDQNLDVILDIPVTISMEIGRTNVSIRNLLQLNQGSVVELDRLAGEPMDVLVNGTLVAHGEVVVVNEKFGIRLTDVVSAAERVKRLG
ncbi:MAG: flagellar motor switch protein FliN [Gammaproteobacteria bacterium]